MHPARNPCRSSCRVAHTRRVHQRVPEETLVGLATITGMHKHLFSILLLGFGALARWAFRRPLSPRSMANTVWGLRFSFEEIRRFLSTSTVWVAPYYNLQMNIRAPSLLPAPPLACLLHQEERFSWDLGRGYPKAAPAHRGGHCRDCQQALDQLRLPPSGDQGDRKRSA